MSKVKLKIKKDLCTNCGTCAMAYEEYFQMQDDGSIDDRKALVPKDQVEEIKNVCPVEAIVKKRDD